MDDLKTVEVDLTNSSFMGFPTFDQKHITFGFETTQKRRGLERYNSPHRGWSRCLTKNPGETEC